MQNQPLAMSSLAIFVTIGKHDVDTRLALLSVGKASVAMAAGDVGEWGDSAAWCDGHD